MNDIDDQRIPLTKGPVMRKACPCYIVFMDRHKPNIPMVFIYHTKRPIPFRQGSTLPSQLVFRFARPSTVMELTTWWRHQMEIFSALLALCEGNPPVTGGFPSQRPVAQSVDVFLDVHLNKRLRKQSKWWWFETPWRSLWRHCNECRINRSSPSVRSSSSWWRLQMETISASLAICAGNSPVPGEFPSQRPVTRSFDAFFDLCPNKRLSKQSRG